MGWEVSLGCRGFKGGKGVVMLLGFVSERAQVT